MHGKSSLQLPFPLYLHIVVPEVLLYEKMRCIMSMLHYDGMDRGTDSKLLVPSDMYPLSD